MPKGKKILLGVTGSIAAYKTAFLVRLLIKSGAEVKVILSGTASDFIGPLTLATLSKNPVYTDMWDAKTGTWTNHVELGSWADLMVIAPATANTIAKSANGLADNLLLTTYLSAKCPVYFAPAMDLDMFQHPATKQNIEKLIGFGNKIISPGNGELASGLFGEGRMAEPEEIFEIIQQHFQNNKQLNGIKVTISAGPTFENIDPVRFIGNRSSGKTGIALAEAYAELGADVTLICGPTHLKASSKVHSIHVKTADEMLDACLSCFKDSKIMVMSAAVADYKPVEVSKNKIKKSGEELIIKLVKNPDILKTLGSKKKKGQILVGFALETNNELANAKEKLKNKNLDLIVLNSLKDKGAGFEGDTNKVSIIDKDLKITKFDLKSKNKVAEDIVKATISLMNK